MAGCSPGAKGSCPSTSAEELVRVKQSHGYTTILALGISNTNAINHRISRAFKSRIFMPSTRRVNLAKRWQPFAHQLGWQRTASPTEPHPHPVLLPRNENINLGTRQIDHCLDNVAGTRVSARNARVDVRRRPCCEVNIKVSVQLGGLTGSYQKPRKKKQAKERKLVLQEYREKGRGKENKTQTKETRACRGRVESNHDIVQLGRIRRERAWRVRTQCARQASLPCSA